jgi:hypothetical protein
MRDDKCPRCGAEEIEYLGPRTHCACGSSDYDGRPWTLVQSSECYLRQETATPEDGDGGDNHG